MVFMMGSASDLTQPGRFPAWLSHSSATISATVGSAMIFGASTIDSAPVHERHRYFRFSRLRRRYLYPFGRQSDRLRHLDYLPYRPLSESGVDRAVHQRYEP